MKYKVKNKNILRLKKYINANTKTKAKQEAELIYNEYKNKNK